MVLTEFREWDERVRRGDLRGIGGHLRELGQSLRPEARGQHLALRVSWYRIDPDHVSVPSLYEIRALSHDGGVLDEMAALAASRLAALGAVCFDFEAARAAIAEGRARLAGEAPLELEIAAALLQILSEPPSERVISSLSALFERARSNRDAFATVDIMSLWALSALRAGHGELVREKARRASRMARAEAFPLHEYLAHLVLARVRRLDGMPHRALRILRALAEVVPAHFRGWLSWELLLSGFDGPWQDGVVADALDVQRQVGEATRRVAACVSAAREGSHSGFSEHTAWIGEHLPRLDLLWEDAQPLLEALDPHLPADSLSSTSVSAWAQGGPALPPRGLSALAAGATESPTEPSLCAVVVGPGRPARRVLATGVPLLPDHVQRLSPKENSAERINTALVVLALQGVEGMNEARLFERIYGFAYRPNVHGGAFRTLLHRVRAYVSGLADIERNGELYLLRVHRSFVVPELRCRRLVVERLLVAVAHAKKTSAREAAEHLGAPLRTVQRALRTLVDDGFCSRA